MLLHEVTSKTAYPKTNEQRVPLIELGDRPNANLHVSVS